jgi:manganese transport protein
MATHSPVAAPDYGWLRRSVAGPLPEVNATVAVSASPSPFRRFVSFLGPGYLVAMGYMDPGNWATSLAGGAKFGMTLLAAAMVSNIMAILLQSLAARLAIGTGRDLAQACRDGYPRMVSLPLWALAEIAIVATDLAEVIGTAIGLKLLFGLPLTLGVLVTALDVLIILALQRLGFRTLEAFVITLLAIIAACFAVQIALANPDWSAVAGGFLPSKEIVTNPEMLYLAMGIVGATVMPHNLYLHSAIIQTRAYGTTPAEKREALTFATLDSTFALMFALLINAAILILAAATFYKAGNSDITDLEQAYTLLSPLLGSAIAPTLFAVALICCGLSSTVTATLAGQAVMEGFLDLKISPWLRRLLTRTIAIVPAGLVVLFYGEAQAGKLLIASQVILGLQLPFAVVPLVLLTADREKLGDLTSPRWLTATTGLIAALLIILNIKLVVDLATGVA